MTLLRLFLLFTVVPAAEIALLIAVGARIGPFPTFLLLVASGVLGSWLARREGLEVLRRLAADVHRGLPPAEGLVEGALVAVGGILLVTPGLISDLLGLALIFPPTRRIFVPPVLAWGRRHVTVAGLGVSVGDVGGPAGRPRKDSPPDRASPFDHPVAR